MTASTTGPGLKGSSQKVSFKHASTVVGYGTFAFKKTVSPPKANEIAHMRPSNHFEDITEDEFNKREQNKRQYQNELFA